MGAEVLRLPVTYTVMCSCCVCGVAIITTTSHESSLRGKIPPPNFHCINGHSQAFTGTEMENLRKRAEAADRALEWEKQRVAQRDKQLAASRGQITKIKNRVGNGVCPCCNRTFQNLLRHMHTKHPEFKTETT